MSAEPTSEFIDRLPEQTKALEEIGHQDAEYVKVKDQQYSRSWRKRGGRGAFFTVARPWDRFESIAEMNGYDIFKVLQDEHDKGISGHDGSLLACVRDLRRYMALIEAHFTLTRSAHDLGCTSSSGPIEDDCLCRGPHEPDCKYKQSDPVVRMTTEERKEHLGTSGSKYVPVSFGPTHHMDHQYPFPPGQMVTMEEYQKHLQNLQNSWQWRCNICQTVNTGHKCTGCTPPPEKCPDPCCDKPNGHEDGHSYKYTPPTEPELVEQKLCNVVGCYKREGHKDGHSHEYSAAR